MSLAEHLIRSLRGWTTALLAVCQVASASAASDADTANGILRHRFRQTLVIETLDGDGKVKETKTEVKDVVPVEGRYLFGRVVSRDGKPLTPQEEKAETRRFEKFRQTVREGGRPKGEDDSFDFLTDDFADFKDGATKQGFEVKRVGTESVKGRDCALLGFSSRPGSVSAGDSPGQAVEPGKDAKPHDAREKKEFEREFVRSVQGRIWVDREEGQPAQLEVRLARPIRMSWCMVNIKRFDLDVDFERLEPKTWLPVHATALINIKAFLFLSYNMRIKLVRDQFAAVSAESASEGAQRADEK